MACRKTTAIQSSMPAVEADIAGRIDPRPSPFTSMRYTSIPRFYSLDPPLWICTDNLSLALALSPPPSRARSLLSLSGLLLTAICFGVLGTITRMA